MSESVAARLIRENLGALRDDFHRMCDSGPFKGTLVHKATNAEAEGVEGEPYSLDANFVVAFTSAGRRDHYQKVDANGNPYFVDVPLLDVKGNPITNSAGEGFDVVMPAHRELKICGESQATMRLQLMAKRAGDLALRVRINPASSAEQGIGWRFSDGEDYWWWLVYELAWSGQHPLLQADRRIWRENCYYPWNIDYLRMLSDRQVGLGVKIPSRWLERLPDAYVSELDDLATASKDAVDWLIKQCEQRDATKAAESEDPGQQPQPNKPKATKLPTLKPHDRRAYQLSLLDRWTQTKIAEQLNSEHGTTYSQGQVAKMIKRAKRHAEASGLSEHIQPAARPARAIAPDRLELGNAERATTPRQREKRIDDRA